jgi:NADH-quinone oxidoreductase subunit L
VLAGYPFIDVFVGHGVEGFFGESLAIGGENHILEEMHHVSEVISGLPTLFMAVGFGVAWLFYIRRPDIPAELARQHVVLYRFLLNKWYFDEIYDFLIVRPTLWLGRLLWKGGDGWLIDGLGPDGVSARVLDVTRNVVRLQTGYMYHYAFAMLIGVAAFITWFMFAGGGH